ncbi:hypothetical protein CsSME_00021627 [Camellia sinensis var. sinensis]
MVYLFQKDLSIFLHRLSTMVKAATGWAHCVSVTGIILFPLVSDFIYFNGSKPTAATVTQFDNNKFGEESVKRRRISSTKQEVESSTSTDETLSAPPCLVDLDPGVRITSVAAGGRHTLALSDVGQVWGWGYGGEGQLGLRSRIKMMSSPLFIPCIEPSSFEKDRSSVVYQGSMNLAIKALGTYIKGIAYAGALLTFGWGLHGHVSLFMHFWEKNRYIICVFEFKLSDVNYL